MFRYKVIGHKYKRLGCHEAGSLWAKPLMKGVKRNKRVIAKSGPPHVENVGSGKSLHPLNKRMLPFLGTVTPRA